MKSKYSEAFIEQAVVKLLSRGGRTVRAVALDLNVNYHTAKNWIKRGALDKGGVSQQTKERPGSPLLGRNNELLKRIQASPQKPYCESRFERL